MVGRWAIVWTSILLFGAASFLGCGGSDHPEALIGKWRVSPDVSLDLGKGGLATTQGQGDVPLFLWKVKTKGKWAAEGTRIQFTGDDGVEFIGEYALQGGDKTLEITMPTQPDGGGKTLYTLTRP